MLDRLENLESVVDCRDEQDREEYHNFHAFVAPWWPADTDLLEQWAPGVHLPAILPQSDGLHALPSGTRTSPFRVLCSESCYMSLHVAVALFPCARLT